MLAKALHFLKILEISGKTPTNLPLFLSFFTDFDRCSRISTHRYTASHAENCAFGAVKFSEFHQMIKFMGHVAVKARHNALMVKYREIDGDWMLQGARTCRDMPIGVKNLLLLN